ncbi:hypothetical protein GCM10007973_01300 [Polymorphobacter multimanifer]|uniref:tetratricopeptide repeat protein n=1 Tax=Polymorphobacter multimanifer TaxID=1070431 RepID=UPI001662E30C|nr:tetratricopeptide repeat protein [Polymorphobacter multimanifer]GGI67886.1 hypothetical protein GCM10007973_01300 [Polymorphobacter multimanifer]
MLAAALAAALVQPAEAAAPGSTVATLNPAQMFKLAQQLEAEGSIADAEAALRALAGDPDLAIRNEARFRLAQLLERQGKPRDAAAWLRRLLDEQPDAARPRLELARILAALGDDRGASRELRQAQAAGLPPDVARVVDRFQTALRSQARLGGTFELALAPDTNINRATALSIINDSIELSPDAVATSGVGLAATGQAFARLPIGTRLNLLPRVSGAARLYGQNQFNDISIDSRIGLERVAVSGGRLTGSLGGERRWFGGRVFTDALSVSLDWLRPVSRTAQVTLNAGVSQLRFPRNGLQDGTLYQLASSYEFALAPRSGAAISASAARQTALDPAFASTSAGLSGLVFRDVGRTTVFGSLAARRFVSDAPLFLFPEPRREWLVRAAVGGTFRQAAARGLAPVVRLSVEHNASNTELFQYTRVAVEIGLGRAF